MQEKEPNPQGDLEEKMEKPFTISLDSALVVFDTEVSSEDREKIKEEILREIPQLNDIEIEDGEMRIVTEFGDVGFWNQTLPQISSLIGHYLNRKDHWG